MLGYIRFMFCIPCISQTVEFKGQRPLQTFCFSPSARLQPQVPLMWCPLHPFISYKEKKNDFTRTLRYNGFSAVIERRKEIRLVTVRERRYRGKRESSVLCFGGLIRGREIWRKIFYDDDSFRICSWKDLGFIGFASDLNRIRNNGLHLFPLRFYL